MTKEEQKQAYSQLIKELERMGHVMIDANLEHSPINLMKLGIKSLELKYEEK